MASAQEAVTPAGLRLDEQVERPLIYLAQRAPAPGGEDVLSSLSDRTLLRALGIRAGTPAGRQADGDASVIENSVIENEVGAGGTVLQSLQRLFSRLSLFSDQSEMALVGMIPLGDRSRPLMVFHTYLRKAGADEMRKLLESGGVATKSRKIHDRQIYRFKAGADDSLGSVEVALVDRDMVVSNDDRTLRRILDPRTTARRGFADEKRYTRLRKRVEVPPGSLLFYADWRALQHHVAPLFSGDASWLMSFSGVEAPEQLMFVARPAPRKGGQKRGIITTAVLHHESRSERRRREHEARHQAKTWSPDGWLDLLEPARAQALVSAMPQGGVLGFSAMFDLPRMLSTHKRSHRMRRLQAPIFNACHRIGIDLRREVLRRLSRSGGAQLLLIPGDEGLRLAWSMRAKSVADAKQLFQVFERMFVPQGSARRVPIGNGQNELAFAPRYAGGPMFLTRASDTIAVAFSSEVTKEVRKLTEARRRTPNYKRQSTALMNRLQRLGVGKQQKIAGAFALDLGFLSPSTEPGPKNLERFRGLLGLHGGFFRFEENLVRLEVFTELDNP